MDYMLHCRLQDMLLLKLLNRKHGPVKMHISQKCMLDKMTVGQNACKPECLLAKMHGGQTVFGE
jgi:hypothetical protein